MDLDGIPVLIFRDPEGILVIEPLIADIIMIIDQLVAVLPHCKVARLKLLVFDRVAHFHIAVKKQRPDHRIIPADPEAGGIITFGLISFRIQNAHADTDVVMIPVPL